jgi:Flp pilus assembly protein TadD
LALQGQPVDAIAQLQQAYNLKPDDSHFQNGLAWMLVTVPGSSHRNGSLALELALKANQASGRRDPLILRTLAAAYAETGHFTEAVETAQQALSLLEEQGLPTEINGLRWELKLYHANRPIQDDQ